MDRLSELPEDMVFFTQITMEAGEDTEFLQAMDRARIKGVLVGVESVTSEGLKAVYKDFNLSGDNLVERLQRFRENGVFVLGSFIFGLPTDGPATFNETAELASRAGLAFAQFVTLSVFPGTLDFARWEKEEGRDELAENGFPVSHYWLTPRSSRPNLAVEHPSLSSDEIKKGTQESWDQFYSSRAIWQRAKCLKRFRSRLAFFLISKLYRQMFANTGIASDSARVNRSARWARLIAKPCQRLFKTSPMPELQVPTL